MNSATRILISTFGGFVGVMGIEHGLGEVLQGNKAPAGMMIQSWPDSAFFGVLGGEPAMTILPNLLFSGLLAILFSLVYLVWAIVLVQRRRAGLVLILTTLPMLLFGAGIFPPVLGLIIGAGAIRLHAPRAWWRTHIPAGGRRLLDIVWPWFYIACLLFWLAMFPGVPVLSYFFGLENETLLLFILAGMFIFLLLAGLTGLARDGQQQIGSSTGA